MVRTSKPFIFLGLPLMIVMFQNCGKMPPPPELISTITNERAEVHFETPASTPPPGDTISAARIKGLYLFINAPRISDQNDKVEEFLAGIAHRYIDGISIMDRWSDVETSQDIYNFEKLNRWIIPAVQAGKKITYGIAGGASSPQWVKDTIPTVTLVWDRGRGRGPIACETHRVPHFWHATYKRRYKMALQAFANHLKELKVEGQADGAAFSALRTVKIGGINRTTTELSIGTNDPRNVERCNSDIEQPWIAAGYTHAKAVAAFKSLVEGANLIFPQKVFAIDLIAGHNSFPIYPVVSPRPDYSKVLDPTTQAIVADAIARYGQRISLQWNSLGLPPNGTFLRAIIAAKGVANIGWQLNRNAGDRTACVRPYEGSVAVLCTPDQYQDVLLNGLQTGDAKYLELHSGDVAGRAGSATQPGSFHPEALLEAHNLLFGEY